MITYFKKSCILCLSVSLILLIPNVIFGFEKVGLTNYFATIICIFLLSIILLFTLWYFVKPILDSKTKFENEVNELKRFKRNFNFFQYLSKNIHEFDGFEKLKGISFGNNCSSIQIRLILSTDNKDCHKAFEEAYHLYQNNSEEIYVTILFNINPNDSNNQYKSVAENLLALNEQSPKKAKEAIIDWHIHRLDFKTWKRKWTVETPHLLINKQLQDQYYWCLKNDFNNSPIRIINENLFPDEYEIIELEYFITDFQNEFEYEESLKVV